MTTPKAGYKGDVEITTAVGGPTRIAMATWTYAGGERQMQAVDEFTNEIITDIPLQIRGGIITITGHYKLDSDAGQKLAAAAFATGEQITDLKLYTDIVGATKTYLMPDNTTDPASYCTVTNCRNVGDDKSGIGTLSMTLLVSGIMKQVGDTSIVQVTTVGVHSILAGGTAELVGNLNSRGGEAGTIKCYFKYGTTTEMSDGPSAPTDDFADPKAGMFGAALTGLATGTVYYQAVAEYAAGPILYAYGAMKKFTAIT